MPTLENPSSHITILAALSLGQGPRQKKHFMISHFLLAHQDFLTRVAINWHESSVQGFEMYLLSRKLELMKNEIRDINREQYSDLEARVKEAHNLLVDSQRNMMHNPSSPLAQLEKEVHRKWITLAIAEENFLQQRSRVLWLNIGDLDTSFFHRMVATGRSANQIHYLILTWESKSSFKFQLIGKYPCSELPYHRR